MRFSTRTTYGLRAMIDLAKERGQGAVPLTKIAQSEKISLKYLEKLFACLKRDGLIKAVKGARGGYRLARDARQIDVYRIVNSLEGGMDLFYCLDNNSKIFCSNKCACGATLVMSEVQQAVSSTLKKIKLSQLV